ncbi:hypothetical protein L1283_005628 [Sphingobacterium sp. HSC-15S19]
MLFSWIYFKIKNTISDRIKITIFRVNNWNLSSFNPKSISNALRVIKVRENFKTLRTIF